MASDDPRAATVTDPEGHQVVLLARVWTDKVTRNHPELADHLDAVIQTVASPDHVEPDALPDRTRFYRRNTGPSRWLMAVVSDEQQPTRIITALANRKDPKRWKPRTSVSARSSSTTPTMTPTSYTCTLVSHSQRTAKKPQKGTWFASRPAPSGRIRDCEVEAAFSPPRLQQARHRSRMSPRARVLVN
jgi:hypothetical protein